MAPAAVCVRRLPTGSYVQAWPPYAPAALLRWFRESYKKLSY